MPQGEKSITQGGKFRVGLYSVIIGDFLTEDIAEHMKETFLEMGFRSVKIEKTKDELPIRPQRTIEEVACEVVRGKWGNLSEQRYRLEKEGYDADAVLSLADEIRRK